MSTAISNQFDLFVSFVLFHPYLFLHLFLLLLRV